MHNTRKGIAAQDIAVGYVRYCQLKAHHQANVSAFCWSARQMGHVDFTITLSEQMEQMHMWWHVW